MTRLYVTDPSTSQSCGFNVLTWNLKTCLKFWGPMLETSRFHPLGVPQGKACWCYPVSQCHPLSSKWDGVHSLAPRIQESWLLSLHVWPLRSQWTHAGTSHWLLHHWLNWRAVGEVGGCKHTILKSQKFAGKLPLPAGLPPAPSWGPVQQLQQLHRQLQSPRRPYIAVRKYNFLLRHHCTHLIIHALSSVNQ